MGHLKSGSVRGTKIYPGVGAKLITCTTFIVEELISQLHTHISYTTLLVEELICVVRVYLWCLIVLPL